MLFGQRRERPMKVFLRRVPRHMILSQRFHEVALAAIRSHGRQLAWPHGANVERDGRG
jgi:hypothetical protein